MSKGRCYIRGRPCWYRLKDSEEGVRGMFHYYPQSSFQGKLIVQIQGEVYRSYTFFDRYYEFLEYQQRFPPQEQCFYEVILGGYPQKPHFDLDINKEKGGSKKIAYDAMKAVYDAAAEVLAGIGVDFNPLKDFKVYSSHSENGVKWSYHFVVHNLCCVDNEEAKAFYERVMERVPESLRRWVDETVYASIQHFRILGTTKYGADRFKILDPDFPHALNSEFSVDGISDEQAKRMTQTEELFESLVSQTSGCRFLPLLSKEKVHTTKLLSDVSVEMLEQAVQAVESIYPGVYKKDEWKDGFYLMKRAKRAYCQVCERVHDSENAYIRFSSTGAYLNCRRNHQSLKLFSIQAQTEKQEEPEEQAKEEAPENETDVLTPEQIQFFMHRQDKLRSFHKRLSEEEGERRRFEMSSDALARSGAF